MPVSIYVRSGEEAFGSPFVYLPLASGIAVCVFFIAKVKGRLDVLTYVLSYEGRDQASAGAVASLANAEDTEEK